MGLFKTANITQRAEKISNFTINTTEYGSPVMELLGTTRISGNVIYYDDFTAHEHRETHRSGKGGGVKTTTITYTYTVAAILGLCEGPVKNVKRVWRNKEVYTYPDGNIQLSLFKGTKEQKPWPYVVGKHPEKALAYPGLAYMAGVIDLGSSASMPNYNFEVQGQLTETGDGLDVNPADYILYILSKIGLKDVQILGLENYRKYCREADLLISTPSDATDAKAARDIVNEIAQLTNSYMFWSNDCFKIVPRADRSIGSWKPDKNIIYDLTPDDFIQQGSGACVSYSRKDSSELFNRFSVEFLNRENAYEKETVSYEDVDDIKKHGLRQSGTLKAHYIYTKKRAVQIAEEMARKNKYERNRYTFKLDWAFCRLEVGDLVTLTDPAIGLDKQVAMIDSVVEDAKGLLTFTAISRAAGDYNAAQYDVHEVDRPYVDFNAPPGAVDKPIIFQPPSELTSNGNELWLGAKGKNKNWGGCVVYVSDNNTNYRRLGEVTNSARMGTLVSNVNAEATSLEVSVNGQFISGTVQDAERANTLCWVDGECLSYTTATLLQNGNYLLEGLVRGQYNTQAAAHNAGSQFVRCDEAVLKSNVRKEDIGKNIWLKFASYNIFGSGEQSLDEVEAYEYILTAYYIPPVTDIRAYNRYRQLQDGVARYDIVVEWNQPNLKTYLEGCVWYKTNHSQADQLTFKEGVSADLLGFDGPWIFGGSGKQQVVIPQAVVGDTYRIAVTTKDEFGVATSPDMAPQLEILVAMKTDLPNTPDKFDITFGEKAVVSWQEVTNTDVMLYEVRYNTNPGIEDSNLLARTNGLATAVNLTSRKGKLYLYAKAANGKYSLPAELEYNKQEPPTPKPPKVTSKLGGMSVVAEPIPNGCNGMIVYINDVSIKSVNNTITYTCDAGIYDVIVAYTDIFGEGHKSAAARCVVKVTVDKDLLEQGSISMDKVDQALNELISSGGGANDKIVQLVKDLNSDGYKKYSAFVQMEDALELRVKDGELISKINMSKEQITIDGKLLHVTGDTIFDKNVITKGMIQANAITADKMDVKSLSSITATIGTLRTATSGARTEIKDNLIEVYDDNNVLRVRMGVW